MMWVVDVEFEFDEEVAPLVVAEPPCKCFIMA